MPYIERAAPTHPSLIDRAHVVDELFGMVNVPNGVWIDEAGTIVRPAEPAHPGRNPETESFRTIDPSTLPAEIARSCVEAQKIQTEPERYVEMVRDWVAHVPDSRTCTRRTRSSPVRRPARRRRPGRGHFELGQHLHSPATTPARSGTGARRTASTPQLDLQAQRVEPRGPAPGPTDAYDSSWFDDVLAIGAEHYYPPLVP